MIDIEILNSFVDESKGLVNELSEVVQKLEGASGEFPAALLEEFAQKIDRIMGGAKTIGMLAPDHAGLSAIGNVAELCKFVGYKASEKKDVRLIPICAAFWADVIEALESLLQNLNDPKKSAEIAKASTEVLQGRLKWLAVQLK